jgi:hypothetical protein
VGVPVAEFTEMLMAQMDESRERAITLMANLGSSATSQQPTPLENTAHILAQARRILSQSRGNVVLCCDIDTLLQLEEFLVDLGTNFPDLAKVFTDSPRQIPGIDVCAHSGHFPMNTGFADNTTENWLLVAANSGQWLSAFYNNEDPTENTHGWVGTNHEVSLPIKTVIGALMDGQGNAARKSQSPDNQVEENPSAVEEPEEPFEPGAIASTGSDALLPEEAPTVEAPEPEKSLEEVDEPHSDEEASPETPDETAGGFEFLVQHEDDEDEEVDNPET